MMKVALAKEEQKNTVPRKLKQCQEETTHP
jgi:hypothetical protein